MEICPLTESTLEDYYGENDDKETGGLNSEPTVLFKNGKDEVYYIKLASNREKDRYLDIFEHVSEWVSE